MKVTHAYKAYATEGKGIILVLQDGREYEVHVPDDALRRMGYFSSNPSLPSVTQGTGQQTADLVTVADVYGDDEDDEDDAVVNFDEVDDGSDLKITQVIIVMEPPER